jgi:hypothetical protein
VRKLHLIVSVVLCITAYLAMNALAQTITSSTSAPGIALVQPTAQSNGHIVTTSTMTDGTTATYDGGVPNTLSLTAYDPVAYPITLASTTQLRGGYVIYDLTGSGIIASATVKLPASPVDRQLARLALLGTFTVTLLTVQDANGTAVGTIASIIGQTDALYQYQGTAWVRIGS